MSQLKLTADGGGGTVAIKAPASTTGNAALDLVVPGTASDTLDTLKRGGNIIQVVSVTKTDAASASIASSAWWSYTDTSLRATITPTSASNKLLITGMISCGEDSSQYMFMRLEKNGVRINEANGDQDGLRTRCMAATPENANNPNMPHPSKIVNYLDTAGSTSSRYYNFGIAHSSGSTRTLYINRGNWDNNSFYMPKCSSTITVMEIAA